jgi:hypothetical protein
VGATVPLELPVDEVVPEACPLAVLEPEPPLPDMFSVPEPAWVGLLPHP